MKIPALLGLFFCAFLCVFPEFRYAEMKNSATTSSIENKHICYSKCMVLLRGKIKYELIHGPPGFGNRSENDVRIRAPILILDNPITVKESEQFLRAIDQNQVQIETDRNLGYLDGKRVDVRGVLRGATTATDSMELVIVVSKIVVIK